MTSFLRLVWAEARREVRHIQAYPVEFAADQALFLFGFLLLSGLFQIVAEGDYTAGARLASLAGFLTWRVADGCLLRIVNGLSNDAQWGTLEQLWLSHRSPQQVLLARSVVFLISYLIRVLIIAAIVVPLLRLSPFLSPAILLVFLLAQVGVLGVAFFIAGIHVVYKSVASLTLAFSTALLFITGALAPLSEGSLVYYLSRFLPLGAGIRLLQKMVVDGMSLPSLAMQADFYWLVGSAFFYGMAGWLVFEWGQRQARRNGSLAHY
jgi:ABC-2 type transport system permease protein